MQFLKLQECNLLYVNPGHISSVRSSWDGTSLETQGNVSGGGKKSQRARKKSGEVKSSFFTFLDHLDFFPLPLI